MGHTDVSWKVVRQATSNSQFCSNLAAQNIEEFSKDQIYSVIDNIKQIKITDDHMARMSDIGFVLLKYLKAVTFFWRRFKEDLSPRHEKLQESSKLLDQLNGEIGEVQESINSCLSTIQTTTKHLQQEQKTSKVIASSIRNLESNLKTNESLMTSLEPHINRWKRQQKNQKQQLSEAFGESLLEAATCVYLAHIPGNERLATYQTIKTNLKDLSLLINGPDDPEELSLPLDIHSNERILESIVECYKSLPSYIFFLFDPHGMENIFFGDCTSMTIGQTDWESKFNEALKSSSPTSVIGTHSEVEMALRIYERNETVSENLRLRFTITDFCKTKNCGICSSFPLLSLELTDLTVQQILCRRFSSVWPLNNKLMSEKMENATNAYNTQRDATTFSKKQLIQILLKSDDTSSQRFIADIREKISAIEEDLTLEKEKLQEKSEMLDIINKEFGDASFGAQRISKSLRLMSSFFPEIEIPFHVIEMELTKLHRKKEHSNKETLKEAVFHSLYDLVAARTDSTLRIIVAVCVAFSQLPKSIAYEDVIMGFLQPLTPLEKLLDTFEDISTTNSIDRNGSDDTSDFTTLEKYAHTERMEGLRVLLKNLFSLFGGGSDSISEEFLEEKLAFIRNWRSGNEKEWSFECNGNQIIKITQKILLSRHFHKRRLLALITEYLEQLGLSFLLQEETCPIIECINQRKNYINPGFQKSSSGVIEIHYKSGTPPHEMLEEARQVLGQANKVIYASQSSLSSKDLEKLLMKSHYQKGWLCFLDCEVQDDLQNIIHCLRSSDPRCVPTVFCFFYRSSHVFREILGIKETSTSLARFLTDNLKNMFDNSKDSFCSLIVGIFLLVSGVTQVRQMITDNDQSLEAVANLEEVSQMVLYYTSRANTLPEIPWDTITRIIKKIGFLRKNDSHMDDSYLFAFLKSTINASYFPETYDGESSIQQDITWAIQDLEDPDFPVKNKLDLVTDLASCLVSKSSEMIQIEDTLGKEIRTDKIIDILHSRAIFHTAVIGFQITLEIMEMLRKVLNHTMIENSKEMDHPKDFESMAWQIEAEEWDRFADDFDDFLIYLKQELVSLGSYQTIIHILRYLKRSCYLEMESFQIPDYSTPVAWDILILGIQKLLKISQHLSKTEKQLMQWATSEAPPHKVNLGLLKSPIRWLNQFKRAICSRAHWNLKGAVVYGILQETIGNERPFQGVYIKDCVLEGGRYEHGKIIPDSLATNSKRTITALVSHSYPVPKHNQKWIPVIRDRSSSEYVMKVLVDVKCWKPHIHLVCFKLDSL